MSGNNKDALDIEEQYRRIVQLTADIDQKRLEIYYLPRQFFLTTAIAGATISGALFTGIKLLLSH